MSLFKKVIIGGGWQYLSQIVQLVLQTIVIMVMARHIKPAEYGIVSIAGIVISFLMLFSRMGIAPALIQKKDITSRHIEVAFTCSLLLGIIVFLIIWILSPSIAIFFNNEILILILRYISLSFIFTAFGTVSLGMLEKEFRFKEIMTINIFSYMMGYALIGIILAVLGYGVWALVIAILFERLLQNILLFIYYPHKIKFSLSQGELKELLNYGIGASLLSVFNVVVMQAGNLIIGKQYGAAQVGYYNRANTMMALPHKNIGGTLDRVLFPGLSRIQNQINKLKDLYLEAIGLVFLILFPTTIILILLSSEFVHILLGDNWDEVIIIFSILMIGVPIRTAVRTSDIIIKVTGKIYFGALIKGVYALYTLLFVYIGSSWGVIGASIGINISLILNFIIITLFTQRLLKYKCLEYFKIYIPGGILGGIVLIETSFIIYYLRYIVNSDIGLVIIIALNSFFCIILPLVLFPNVFRVFWIYFFRVIKLATVNENIFIRFYKNKILNKLARYG